jgi:hypothetical protein
MDSNANCDWTVHFDLAHIKVICGDQEKANNDCYWSVEHLKTLHGNTRNKLNLFHKTKKKSGSKKHSHERNILSILTVSKKSDIQIC